MTKEELAALLNGREIGNELTREEAQAAKKDGLVVVYGYLDDIIELDGAIHDEVDAIDGGECYIKNGTLVQPLDDEHDMEILGKYGVLEIVQFAHKGAVKIVAKWDHGGYSWFMDTTAPYAPFEIMEGNEKFCRGIVIDILSTHTTDNQEPTNPAGA